MLKQLLAARGIHYMVTRFGPKKLRSLAFDAKYERGDWSFNRESSDELPATVRSYGHGGDLLILGCGSATIFASLPPLDFSSVLGVDLSEEALRRASRFANANVSFVAGDMVTFHLARPYDVILFPESFYYVPSSKQLGLLKRLCENLKPNGAFIVTLAQAERYRSIIEVIRGSFHVLEDRNFESSKRHLLVFRGSK